MSAHPNAGSSLALRPRTRELIEQLERVYRMSMLTDPTGHVIEMSEGWLRSCREHVGNVIGLDLRTAIPKLPRPEQSFAILSELRQRGFISHSAVEICGLSGQSEAVELSIFPLLPGTEEPPVLVLIARPMAERSKAERHPLLESQPDPLIAVDNEGFVQYANPATERLLGMERSDLEGRPLALLARNASTLERLLAALAAGEPAELELGLHCGNGATAEVNARVAPNRDAGGDMAGAVFSLRKASAPRGEATELRRRNHELEHCVNTLAHDLRSPLVALLGFSRLLRQDYAASLDDTGTHFIDRIEQAGRTMESLIHDLLELSRIGRRTERPGLVDPRGVLLQLAAELKPRLDGRDIRLSLPDDPPLVYCDRTRLYQVFSNLIGNAIDHMGECDDRRIVVSVAEDEGGHRVSVRDFGQGIAPEDQDRIFEVFQTLRSERSGERVQGTGMGLTIVRKIAETHDGRAWVESRPGAGAAFHVLFPRP